ncbi:unnamed protein product [Blepharisma stoltei]|uniref:Phosphatidylinositol-3,4,5-trisphosphate 3-phosphatase n=1 Tax=Blepharisma stoltei TaxID=1481888 RepID=A0AAU9JYF8_9CILI|nr:unnamed protein product [Blepharisma stoltei]
MVDYLRAIVSGKKKRLKEDGFNLDLSYITPRVIAMSIPGEGLSKIYRNSLDSVSKFLNDRHNGKYRILNLSGIQYDYRKFGDSVKEFPWPDHYPPPVELLFKACKDIHLWLSLDPQNVIAVNCRAGKGRTGTLICCYLIYSGRISDPNQSLLYYKRKRFVQGGGVTQPSQVRYVGYFAEIFHGRVKGPLVVQLSRVQLRTAPHVNGNSSKPFIDMYRNNQLVYSSRESNRDRQKTFQDSWEELQLHEIAVVDKELLLQGDILCKLSHWGAIKYKRICRFSFNTGFTAYGGVSVFPKLEIDPYKFKSSKKVSDQFAINLIFQQICACTSNMEIEDRCQICKANLELEEIERWESIKGVLLERIQMNPSVLLFGDPSLDDIDEELNKSESELNRSV